METTFSELTSAQCQAAYPKAAVARGIEMSPLTVSQFREAQASAAQSYPGPHPNDLTSPPPTDPDPGGGGDDPPITVVGNPPYSGGGGGGGGGAPPQPDPPDQNTEEYGDGANGQSHPSHYTSSDPETDVVVTANNFVHTAGLNALGYSNFDASLGPKNEVGEVIVVAHRADGTMQLTLNGLWIADGTYGNSLGVEIKGPDLSHTLHTHPDGYGYSDADLKAANNEDVKHGGQQSVWEVISSKSGDQVLANPAGLSDFGLNTGSPGVSSTGLGQIYVVTLVGSQDMGWRH